MIRPRYRQIHAVSIKFGHLLHHRLVVPTRNLSELQLLPCTAADDRLTADLLRPTAPSRHANQRRRPSACCRDLISASPCLYDYAASIIACHFREPPLIHASVLSTHAGKGRELNPKSMLSVLVLAHESSLVLKDRTERPGEPIFTKNEDVNSDHLYESIQDDFEEDGDIVDISAIHSKTSMGNEGYKDLYSLS
ncbi:hypothetical protein ACLOJK_023797 [Asimina triloba]